MVHRTLLGGGCSHLVACWAIKAPQVQIEGGVPSRATRIPRAQAGTHDHATWRLFCSIVKLFFSILNRHFSCCCFFQVFVVNILKANMAVFSMCCFQKSQS